MKEMLIKTHKAQTIEHAADIFMAHKGVEDAQRKVTIAEAEEYKPAKTFEEFLIINEIAVYESELRNANI